VNNKEILENIANKILVKAGLSDTPLYGSAIIILMLISVVLTSIRILQECNKVRTKDLCLEDRCTVYGEEIRDYSNKRGWFTKLRIKRLLKREMNREDYEKYGLRLVEAILDIGETLKEDEIQTLVENANV